MDGSCLLLFNMIMIIMSMSNLKCITVSNLDQTKRVTSKPKLKIAKHRIARLTPRFAGGALPDRLTWCGVLINSNNDYDNNKFQLTSVQQLRAGASARHFLLIIFIFWTDTSTAHSSAQRSRFFRQFRHTQSQ